MDVRFVGSVIAALLAWPAAAQDWDWRVTPYIWGSGIQGNIGIGNLGRDVDVDFSELLDVLTGTALLHVEAENGQHVIFGDVVWLAAAPEDEIATIGGVAEAEIDSSIIELGYARGSARLGFEVGLRYWDFDMEIDPALAASITRGDSWIDVFGGLRNLRELGDDWRLTTRANVGAGGSDLSIGFQMDFARELRGGNAFVAGIKLLDVDYEEDNVRGLPVLLDTTFFGTSVGFTFD